MPQSLVKIYVHVIFATKGREAMILPEYESDIYQRLQSNLIKMGADVIAINGIEDHLHLLLKLAATKSISETIRWSKGETSHWFNNELTKDTEHQLYWQDGYAAFSVSEEELKNVKQYIKNQKEIHVQRTFSEEIKILKGKIK